MTFEEMLDQALAMLQRRGRVTYRALKLQFTLDDDQLEALTDELLYAHPQVVDDAGRGLPGLALQRRSHRQPQHPPRPRTGRRCHTPHHIWPRKSSPPRPPWKANASR